MQALSEGFLELLYPIVAVLVGFVVLVWSADRFVYGASALARNLGVDPLIIGLTICGFGTSAPEMLVSGMAAFSGSPMLGIGNAVGSNIANLTLVLGCTALYSALRVRSTVVIRELPILLFVMVFAGVLMLDGTMSRVDGLALLGGMCLMIVWVTYEGIKQRQVPDEPLAEEFIAEIPVGVSTMGAFFWVLLGLLLLLAASRLLVWGAIETATYMGVSELIIGLTIVAVGTSLPELAASLAAAMRNQHDIAVGNVVGSNLFNTLGVLGIPGVIAPGPIDPQVLTRDFPVMIGATITFLVMTVTGRPDHVSRLEGALLLTAFFVYVGFLYAS